MKIGRPISGVEGEVRMLVFSEISEKEVGIL